MSWICVRKLDWRYEAQCRVSSWLSPTISLTSQHPVLGGPRCAEQGRESHVCGLISSHWGRPTTASPHLQMPSTGSITSPRPGQCMGSAFGPSSPLSFHRYHAPQTGHQHRKVGVPHPFMGHSHSPLHFLCLGQAFTTEKSIASHYGLVKPTWC